MNLRNFYLVIAVSVLYIFNNFLGIAFTGGDDPFISLSHLDHDGILNSSIKQSQGQGRFYYIIPWSLTQLSYYYGFEIASYIKIITSFILLFVYLIFIRKLFGTSFSVLNFFITLLFFDWWGGDFNIIHNSPLWYSLGTIFLILSFITFLNESCSNSKYFPLTTIFFLLSILFYEIFVLFSIIYPIWFYLNEKYSFNIKSFYKLLSAFRFIFIICFLYLAFYFLFRYYYPSQYEGNQSLYFGDLANSLFTIFRMTLIGLGFKYWNAFTYLTIFKSITLSAIISYSTFSFLKKNYENPSIEIKKIIMIIFCAILPNILIGFSKKYHVWYGPYVGSSISALFLIPCITMVVNLLNLKFKIFKIFFLIMSFTISSFIFMNFIHKFEGFKLDKLKIEALGKVLNEIEINPVEENIIYIEKNLLSSESYYIYNYLDKLFSSSLNKQIMFKEVTNENVELFKEKQNFSYYFEFDLKTKTFIKK